MNAPNRHEACVASGLIKPAEDIKNPELRELYEKAWTIGLMKAEKERFRELKAAAGI